MPADADGWNMDAKGSQLAMRGAVVGRCAATAREIAERNGRVMELHPAVDAVAREPAP